MSSESVGPDVAADVLERVGPVRSWRGRWAAARAVALGALPQRRLGAVRRLVAWLRAAALLARLPTGGMIVRSSDWVAMARWPGGRHGVPRRWRGRRPWGLYALVGAALLLLILAFAVPTSTASGYLPGLAGTFEHLLMRVMGVGFLLLFGELVLIMLERLVFQGRGPADVALNRCALQRHVVIDWVVPTADEADDTDRDRLVRAIASAARSTGASVATSSGRVRAHCGSKDGWEHVVERWAPSGSAWTVRALPDHDSAGRTECILHCGEVRARPGGLWRVERRAFWSSVFYGVEVVALVILFGCVLGVMVAQPAERDAWRHMTAAERAHRSAWDRADALYWTVTTITTTGYGDVMPVTTAGRVVAIVDMVVGYAGLGLLIGYLAGKVFSHEQFRTEYLRRWVDGQADATGPDR